MYQSNTVKTGLERLQLSCQNSGKQRRVFIVSTGSCFVFRTMVQDSNKTNTWYLLTITIKKKSCINNIKETDEKCILIFRGQSKVFFSVPYFTAIVSKTFLHFIYHSTGGKAKSWHFRGCKMTLKMENIYSVILLNKRIYSTYFKVTKPCFLIYMYNVCIGWSEPYWGRVWWWWWGSFDLCSILFHLIIYFNTVYEAMDDLIYVFQLLSYCWSEHKWHNAHFVKCFSRHWTDTGGIKGQRLTFRCGLIWKSGCSQELFAYVTSPGQCARISSAISRANFLLII